MLISAKTEALLIDKTGGASALFKALKVAFTEKSDKCN